MRSRAAVITEFPRQSPSLSDQTEYSTNLTVDGLDVELSNLTSVVAYEVVSSDSARVGIGGCGAASQSRPAMVTVAYDQRSEPRSYELYRREPDCAPHPLEIMAVYASYQSRS